jgi:hypothetical protein
MFKEVVIWFLLAASVTGFAYSGFYFSRFLKAGAQPTSVLASPADLPDGLKHARARTLLGIGLFSAALVLMLLITGIWGPVVI